MRVFFLGSDNKKKDYLINWEVVFVSKNKEVFIWGTYSLRILLCMVNGCRDLARSVIFYGMLLLTVNMSVADEKKKKKRKVKEKVNMGCRIMFGTLLWSIGQVFDFL